MPDKDEAAVLRARLKKRLEARRAARKTKTVKPVKKPSILKGLKDFLGLEDLLGQAADKKKKK